MDAASTLPSAPPAPLEGQAVHGEVPMAASVQGEVPMAEAAPPPSEQEILNSITNYLQNIVLTEGGVYAQGRGSGEGVV